MNSNFVIYNKKRNVKEISQKFGISPLTSVILCNRDLFEDADISKILSSDLNDLNPAKLLPDVDKGAKLLNEYILSGKSIRIVGDYDVDGVCSTFILCDCIKKLGGNVSYYIPDRFSDGYGINISIIDKAIEDKVDLIITCDNGIAAKEQIAYAKSKGIEVIVTDHHDITELPKDAYAIIDPKRKDLNNTYPFAEICGAVVALKFMIRYYELFGDKSETLAEKDNSILENYLDFAMIATISDIMPLVDENHIIAKVGLKKIASTRNKGLKKLLDISGFDYVNKELTAYHIGFIIGPLINAAGRMDSAIEALKLFLEEDDDRILSIAMSLKKLNDERKNMTETGTKLAISKIEEEYINDKVIVIYIEGLGEQVAGIVAGRIKDRYNKPVIVLTDTNAEDEAKASCRSIEAYDMFLSLSVHKDIFLKFGGHKLAAGFSIKKSDIDALRKMLNDESVLTNDDFAKKIYIDADFPFYEMNESIVKDIEKLEPYGQKFTRPVFATKDTTTKIENVYGSEQNVVKLSLTKDGRTSKGVLFEDATIIKERLTKGNELDIVYYPKINEYMGYTSIDINLIAYR